MKKPRDLEIAETKFFKISYGAMVFVVICIFGFGVWMARMESRAEANYHAIESAQIDYKALNRTLINIDKRLSNIETLLKNK